jgi:hypothetical protein
MPAGQISDGRAVVSGLLEGDEVQLAVPHFQVADGAGFGRNEADALLGFLDAGAFRV